VRILVVTNGFPPRGQWGTEFYTLQLVRGLRARGHELAVLHPERGGKEERFTLEKVDQDGMPIYLLHNQGDPRKVFEDSYRSEEVEQAFRGVVEEFKPDLIHFTYLLWGLSIRMPVIAREMGVPTVVTLTDYGLLCHRGQMYDWRLTRCFGPHPPEVCARCIREPSAYDDTALKLFARRAAVRTLAALGGMGRVVTTEHISERERVVQEALRATNHFIAPTDVLGDIFQRSGVPAEKLTRLVYSIEEEPLVAARPNPGGRGVRFGFLGQFTPHKGLGTLLDAVRLLSHRLPESVESWSLSLYGAPAGGRHRLYADKMISSELGPRVQIKAAFPPTKAPEVLARLHAIIVPSEWDENAPLTVLQARAAGVPVIATDVPGVAEVLEDGVHGTLVPVGDSEELANAMGRFIIGGARRTEAPEVPLTLPDHIDRITAIYDRVAEEGTA